MRLARFVLILQVLVFGLLGLAYNFFPYEMANLNGMLLMESQSISQIRTWYGGLQMGLALFLLWAMRNQERTRSALVMLMFSMGMLVLARLASLLVDRHALGVFDGFCLAWQTTAWCLATLAWWPLREGEQEEATPAIYPQEPLRPFRVGDTQPSDETPNGKSTD